MSTANILILENQRSQFADIKNKLDEFVVFPESLEEFDTVMNWVSIYLNNRYHHARRIKALNTLKNYIARLNINLFIIDYKLTGCHDGKTGISLATELTGDLAFPDIPIIFLSGMPNSAKDVKDNLPIFKNCEWVEKGYTGLNLFEDNYFGKYVKSRIPLLLDKSKIERYLKKLDELLKIPILDVYYDTLHDIRNRITETKMIADREMTLIDGLHQQIDNPYNSAIKELFKKFKQ